MNSSFLAPCKSFDPCMCILSNWLTSFWRESAADCISFIQKFLATQRPVQSLIHTAKRCCYRKSLPEAVLRIRIFLMCIPLVKKQISQQTKSMTETLHRTWSCSQNTGALYFGRRILYLNSGGFCMSVWFFNCGGFCMSVWYLNFGWFSVSVWYLKFGGIFVSVWCLNSGGFCVSVWC